LGSLNAGNLKKGISISVNGIYFGDEEP